MNKIAPLLPSWLKRTLRPLRDAAVSACFSGKERYCPVCERTFRRFARGGSGGRDEAMCVGCGALERHRFLWIFLWKKTDLFNRKPKAVLHIAPEECLEPALRNYLGEQYLTADLLSPTSMVQMDITDIQYPADSFDVIFCCHVLEHVADDRQAMREFYRVLKSGGWAILLVPICGEITYEDPSIVDPLERLRVFGQEDHVRSYGVDYVDRLRETGFTVKKYAVNELCDADEATRMGLTDHSGDIFFCTK